MTYPIMPMALPQLPMAVAGQMTPSAEMQVGTVVRFSASGLFVSPGGDAPEVLAGYLRNMYQPALGDTVALIRQGATWLALGDIAGPEDGRVEVQNYSFQDSDPGVFPIGWTHVSTAGSPTFVTASYPHPDTIDGDQVGSIAAGTAGAIDTSVYSAPIPVTPGESWGLSFFYRPNNSFGANPVTLRLYGSWYSSSDMSTSLISDTGGTAWIMTRGNRWERAVAYGEQSKGLMVPPTAVFLRVRIRAEWTAAASDVIYLDRVMARRIA